MKIERIKIEEHRADWARIAKQRGWYREPFFVQIWLNDDGSIDDSIAFLELESDCFLDRRTDRIIHPEIV